MIPLYLITEHIQFTYQGCFNVECFKCFNVEYIDQYTSEASPSSMRHLLAHPSECE